MNLENVEDVYGLSPAQEGMLFHTVSDPQPGVYVEQICCLLRGDLDVAALQRSWEHLVQRYSVLRTIFLWDGVDAPLQVVREQVEVPFARHDWRGLTVQQQRERLESFLGEDRRRGFELSQAPLLRISLLHEARDRWRLIWSFHHLLCDGWSASIILNELLALYETECRGQVAQLTNPFPYKNYIAWLGKQDREQAERFWRKQLEGFTNPTRLRVHNSSPESGSNDYQSQQFRLTQEATERLRSFVRQHRLTVNTAIHGAWSLVLSRYSGEDDIVYGATVSGRTPELPGIENAVGLFINTLPMRVRVSPDSLLVPWLEQIQQRQMGVREFEYSRLSAIQTWSEIPRGQPLFQSLVVFENYPQTAKTGSTSSPLEIAELDYHEQSNYPLALLVVPAEQLTLMMVHDSQKFDAAFVTLLLRHVATLLESFTESPKKTLAAHAAMGKDERNLLLHTWNNSATDCPRDVCIHELFEQQVARNPDKTAVIFQQQQLTYRELNDRADALARRLALAGTQPEDRIGLFVERRAEMIVGILGILKAGGAYVPLDPTYPTHHLHYVMQDAGVRTAVTQQRLLDQLPGIQATRLCLDDEPEFTGGQQSVTPKTRPASEQLAYTIYTSGSTGKPKGVLVTHRNLVHSTTARFHFYDEPVGRFLLLSSFAFDSSLAGIFWTLCGGGTLVVPPLRLEQDLARLLSLIADQRITHTLCLPSLYQLILQQARPAQMESLKAVIVAGETCPRSLCTLHYSIVPEAALFNEYGPTEATVWSTVYQIARREETGAVPIGKPIANTQVFLLDHHFQPVPRGVSGELYLAGEGLARGYLHRPDLTADKFIERTIGEKRVRLYRTGDLACYREDGNLLFLGRVDKQVKIRGYRIEPGEIEQVLQQHPQIREAAVISWSRPDHSASPATGESPETDLRTLARNLSLLDPATAEEMLSRLDNLSEDNVNQLLMDEFHDETN